MADSPQTDTEGVLRVSVFSDGNPIRETAQLRSVDIRRAVSQVPTARLVFTDGDMPKTTFPLSDTDVFKPGATIRIRAGYGDSEETIFEGLVVRHGVKISGNNDSRLVIECCDKAMRMTVGRRSDNFIGLTDGQIIARLLTDHDLKVDVAATTPQHEALVQHHCTDWDFMLTRADANGLLVIARDGAVSVQPPQASGSPTLTVAYGSDLLEFDADMDARTQWAAVQGASWDPKTQSLVEGQSAEPPSLHEQGDLDGEILSQVAGLDLYRLQSAAPLSKDELTSWAKAQQVKAGLARLRGRMKFQGNAKAEVGGLIELKDVGARFNGNVFVGAVSHSIADGNWVTEVEFGLSPGWSAERSDVMGPPASGLLPGVEGLQIGVVAQLHGDPAGDYRVQVTLPMTGAASAGVWARLTNLHGSNGFGTFFVPEVGDEVVLGYFNNHPSHPVILGSLYSSKRRPPYALEAGNSTQAIVTRSRSKIEFNDDDRRITVSTPGGNKIVLSDKNGSIVLTDAHQNTVTLDTAGITLASPKDIVLNAQGKITLEAEGAIAIASKADVTSSGLNVRCEAQVDFEAKGTATAELSAAGQTVVKGAMVMIN